MSDATDHILGVSDELTQTWYDIGQHTNRQTWIPSPRRRCGTVEVEQVGEEKAYMAVIGTMQRCASWHCGGV
jgi:hypothetical protein